MNEAIELEQATLARVKSEIEAKEQVVKDYLKDTSNANTRYWLEGKLDGIGIALQTVDQYIS